MPSFAARRRRAPPPSLVGRPGLPFKVRYNLTAAATDKLLDYIALVMTVLGAIRFRFYLTPPAYAWLAIHLLVPGYNIVWRVRCQKTCPDGGSYGRWREVTAAITRGTAMGFGIAWMLTRAALLAEGAGRAPVGSQYGGGAGMAVDIINLLNISGLPVVWLQWFKSLRFGWAFPLQLSLAVYDATCARSLCSVLSKLQLQPLLNRAFGALDKLPMMLQPMLLRHASAHRTEVDKCAAVIAFLQLGFGIVVPAAARAAAEARMFAEHQRQRRALGLSPEKGWHARLYGAIGGAAAPQQWAVALLLWWGTLAVVWEVSLLLVGPAGPAALPLMTCLL